MTRPSLVLLLIAGVIAGRGFYRGWLADVEIQRIKNQTEAAARVQATPGELLIPQRSAL